MKKLISIFLILYFIGLNQFCLAVIDVAQFDIQLSPVILNSKLKKDFSGFEYTITNNFKEQINIVNAQIKNGYDGNIGYQKSEAEGAIGLTWAIAGPVGLFTLGAGWVVGLIATPIVWVVQKNKNKKIQTEAISYTNIIPIGVLNPNESVSVKTLVPIGSQPQLKLNITDSKKNIYTINR